MLFNWVILSTGYYGAIVTVVENYIIFNLQVTLSANFGLSEFYVIYLFWYKIWKVL